MASLQRKARDTLLAMAETAKAENAPNTPTTRKPQPLAVISSGFPIAEVITQLAEAQKAHPDAEVRRGTGNRWDLWSRPDQGEPVPKPQRPPSPG
jgi:hypothetical protein